MGIKFQGKNDVFIIDCEDCSEELTKKPTSSSMLSGYHITCLGCGSSGLVYDDGGIYKLTDSDSSLQIVVQ